MTAATAGLQLPEPSATARALLSDGSVTVVRRHGNPHGPRVVFSHGCGFAADLYWPYWSLLVDDCDVVVYDLRSHGWNEPSDLRVHNMPTLADDNRRILEAVQAAFGAKPTIGVYHSLATMPALMHEHQWPAFAGLLLFDPPIFPPGAELDDMETVCQGLAAMARRRPRRFESPQELASMLKKSPAFSLVSEAVQQLFAETTLRPAPDGGYEMRCPPEHEAQLFEWYFGHSMQALEVLDEITIPIKVVGADPTAPFSFLPSTDLSTLTELDYDYLPDLTHLLPLEDPESCAAITTEFMQRIGHFPVPIAH
ncbi:MAG: alpha/beta hydrolase [Acidimicrobiaceae bacterium]|nr:alpha/beta hydrolase [Acidimicrobiaceae bacterium]MYH78901.1 alpha/beta hydrolase [Acidimicrobiaceae bacterium]MYK76602.1 alpha/beta hydrolase [Acidimicrobiaceae bacterium]